MKYFPIFPKDSAYEISLDTQNLRKTCCSKGLSIVKIVVDSITAMHKLAERSSSLLAKHSPTNRKTFLGKFILKFPGIFFVVIDINFRV